MNKEEQNSLFDWSLYGALVKNARRKMGYKTAEAFSATIWRRTRYHISKDTLYKIEQGKQMPDAAQFMAISLVLEKSFYPASIGGICASSEWQGIANGEGIPAIWKFENYEDGIPDALSDSNNPGVIDVAIAAGEYSFVKELFAAWPL